MSTLNENTQTSMLNRLARVEGQLRGIQKLINQDADCEKVIQQMSASRKALDKAFHEMLACIIEKEVLQSNDVATHGTEALSRVKQLLSKYS